MNVSKNINIELPEKLHKDLKLKAVENGTTMKDLIIDILSK